MSEDRKTSGMGDAVDFSVKKMIVFAIPLMLSGILQLTFNAADLVVVGRFAGSNALAAVGATTALITMIIQFFIGLSVGANVIAAQAYGAGDRKRLCRVTAGGVPLAIISGAILTIVFLIAARPALIWMGTPDEILDDAVLYMSIYSLCMPFHMLYNIVAAVLRGMRDSKRPVYCLTFGGALNVVLNLIFVIGFKMAIVGVGIATVASQVVSGILVTVILYRKYTEEEKPLVRPAYAADCIRDMLKLGIPAGLQNAFLCFANVVIQSSVNSFGVKAMAGFTAANSLNGFALLALIAISQTSLSFAGQATGARQWKEVDRVLVCCSAMSMFIGSVLGAVCFFFGDTLLRIYSSDPEVIALGMIKLRMISLPYGLCGLMEVLPNVTRGMGFAMLPTIMTTIGTCVYRIGWIYTIFQMHHSLEVLYLCLPTSWVVTCILQGAGFLWARKKKMDS